MLSAVYSENNKFMDHLFHCIQSIIELVVILAGSYMSVSVCRINLRHCETKQSANHLLLNSKNASDYSIQKGEVVYGYLICLHLVTKDPHSGNMFRECVTDLSLSLRSIKATNVTQILCASKKHLSQIRCIFCTFSFCSLCAGGSQQN